MAKFYFYDHLLEFDNEDIKIIINSIDALLIAVSNTYFKSC